MNNPATVSYAACSVADGKSPPPYIRIKGVTKALWTERGAEIVALSGIDLEMQEGAFVAVVGPSGCAKTTLLNQMPASRRRQMATSAWEAGRFRDRHATAEWCFRLMRCFSGEPFAATSSMDWRRRASDARTGVRRSTDTSNLQA